MNRGFPYGRKEKGKALLAAVEEVREVLVAGAEEAEENWDTARGASLCAPNPTL